jgi:hypothetical protein
MKTYNIPHKRDIQAVTVHVVSHCKANDRLLYVAYSKSELNGLDGSCLYNCMTAKGSVPRANNSVGCLAKAKIGLLCNFPIRFIVFSTLPLLLIGS